MSAHRDPEIVADYCRNARMRGLRVIIAGAGLSAALPGVAAAHTDLPVIGVPLSSRLSALGGLDAILSIVQMPPGVPVAVRRPRQRAQRRPSGRAHPGLLSDGWRSSAHRGSTSRARAPTASSSRRPLQIFAAHVDVLLTLAIVLVAPVTLFVDGVWGGLLADGLDAKPSLASQITSALLSACIVLPLVTGASRAARPGPRPRRGAARRRQRAAGREHASSRASSAPSCCTRSPSSPASSSSSSPASTLGVRCYFATQAAALDGLGAGGGDAPQRRGRAGLVVAHARRAC